MSSSRLVKDLKSSLTLLPKAIHMNTSITYLVNKKGKKTAVQLSIGNWNRFLKEHQHLLEYKKIKIDLTEAIKEIRLIEKGYKKSRTLNQFLNGL